MTLAAADRRISVVDNPTGKIATAINLAFRSSRHPVVVRVDGHSMLPPGYIRTALQTLRETGAANVGGIMAAEGITPFQQAVAWAMTSPYGVGAARNHTGGEPGPADTAYLGVFRREAVEQAGGYNEKFEIAEDWELNHRIRQAGGLIWFQPSLRVTYRPRTTVRALGIQYFRYGRWRRVVARQHRRHDQPALPGTAACGRGHEYRNGSRAGRCFRRWPRAPRDLARAAHCRFRRSRSGTWPRSCWSASGLPGRSPRRRPRGSRSSSRPCT